MNESVALSQLQWLKQVPPGGHIPNRLRLFMWVAGLENKTLAERAHLSEQYVSAIAHGHIRSMSLVNARRLAEALELPVTVEEVFP